MNESDIRGEIVRFSRSLFERRFTVGSSGNLSVRLENGLIITPTNSSLGFLEPDRLSKLDRTGAHISGDKPSKEVFLHQAFYETRPQAGAVVHLHSTYATALSCLPGIDPDDAVPALTPYVVMRVGKVKLIPYLRPGDPALGDRIRDLRGHHAAVLLANHGPVVAAKDLAGAVAAIEELEETAKLALLLHGRPARQLTSAQIAELEKTFGKA
jgi:ribulose-5-phosphate 4-epimerase/fuculose-1-phosphate aldolase